MSRSETRRSLPLPMETVRFFLGEFRAARARMAAARGHPDYLRNRSVAHQCQLRVKELRRDNPRARRKKPPEEVPCPS